MTRSLLSAALILGLAAGCTRHQAEAETQAAARHLETTGQTVIGDAIDWSTAPTLAAVGEIAPDFTLPNTSGASVSLSELVGNGHIVVLEWFNPDCPVSRRYHTPERRMAATFASFEGRPVSWLAINSGAPGHQGAGLERNQAAVADYDVPYPVCLDPAGDVGHLYGAKTTPHMFVIDSHGILAYAGGIDDSRSGSGEVNYAKLAVEALLADQPVATPRAPQFGCSVKY